MRLPAVCGRDFTSMAAYVAHLRGCQRCMVAHAVKRRKKDDDDERSD